MLTASQLAKAKAQQRKLAKRLYQRKYQQTCQCDRYWFPHRYQFGKCLPIDAWDRIALELGAIKKKVAFGKSKIPF